MKFQSITIILKLLALACSIAGRRPSAFAFAFAEEDKNSVSNIGSLPHPSSPDNASPRPVFSQHNNDDDASSSGTSMKLSKVEVGHSLHRMVGSANSLSDDAGTMFSSYDENMCHLRFGEIQCWGSVTGSNKPTTVVVNALVDDAPTVTNLALNKPSVQSTNYDLRRFPAGKANDGYIGGVFDISHTHGGTGAMEWWKVYLGPEKSFVISKIVVYNRGMHNEYLNGAKVKVFKRGQTEPTWESNPIDATNTNIMVFEFNNFGGLETITGNEVIVELYDGKNLHLREVEVMGYEDTRPPVIAIATSTSVQCALTDEGHVYCWGIGGDKGEFGDGVTPGTNGGSHRIQLFDNNGNLQYLEGIVHIVGGSAHFCGVHTNGSLCCWGEDGDGQSKSLNAIYDGSTPGTSVKHVSLGPAYTCVVSLDNTIRCYGAQNHGFSHKPNGLVTKIDTGSPGHVCYLLDTFEMECFGNNTLGVLGIGYDNGSIITTPGRPNFPVTDSRVSSFSAGSFKTCAILISDNSQWCWGWNLYYQLGLVGDSSNSNTPQKINVTSNLNQASISGINTHNGYATYVILEDGKVYCWGINTNGGLGIGSTDSNLTIGDSTSERAYRVVIIPTRFPPSTLNIANQYFIALIENSTVAAFNEAGIDNEIQFDLKITDDSLDGFGNDSVTVLNYETCDGVPFAEGVVSAGPDLEKKVVDGIYAEVPILVNINTTDIENISSGYPGYFTAEDERVFLRFCVKSQLGELTIYNKTSGADESTSISYSKVKIEVEVNMTQGFESASVAVKEESPEDETVDTSIEFELEACECGDDGECISEEALKTKTQNSMVNICIYTPASNDVIISEIKEMQIVSNDPLNLVFYAISEFQANSVTLTKSMDEGKKQMVSTRLVSAFFTDLGEGVTSSVNIMGTAVMEFASSSEPLARNLKLGRVGSAKQEDENNIGMNGERTLDEGAGTENTNGGAGFGAFAVELGISVPAAIDTSAADAGRLSAVTSISHSLVIGGFTLIACM